MTDKENKTFVNLSNKPFEHRTYNKTSPKAFSYKPDTGFWGATKKDNRYFSEWDKEYGLEFIRNDNSENIYVTTFSFDEDATYFLRPAEDDVILEGFNNFLKSKGDTLSPEQKRQLLVETVKSNKGLPNIKNVICLIDYDTDLIELERIFGNFNRDGENEPEVFENLGFNIRRALVENFAGVEVTENAINYDGMADYDIISLAEWTAEEFPGYIEQVGFWDVPSIAVFDTSAIDNLQTRVLTPKEIDKIEEQRDGMEI